MTTPQELNEMPVYRTLEDIRLRKAQLLSDIVRDSNHVGRLWNRLFHKPEKGSKTSSRRLSTIMNTGAGVLDGLILGWKLYRKFKRR